MVYDDLLLRFTQTARALFGRKLTGVYLHGSAAMGCFNPEKSDLDLILVAEDAISDQEKMEFMKAVIAFDEEAPAKGIELSIVKKEFCLSFVYPTPFELHFSREHLGWFFLNPWDYIAKMKGTDKDLAAHFTILKSYGFVLYGEDIRQVFSPVPKADYLDSIWYDIENAREDILNNPLYITLNLCRALAYARDQKVCSKQSGGMWGLYNLPERFHPLIRSALACYASDHAMTPPSFSCVQFADYMLGEIQSVISQQREMDNS